MTDPIAQVSRILVRRVLHGVQTEPGAQVVGLGASQGENRVAGARAHRGKPVGGGPPEQVDEDRLGLIVGRVAGSGAFRQGTEPSRTRPRLEVGPGADVDSVNDDLDAERRRRPRSRPLTSSAGVLSQAVVDVMGDHVAAGGDREHEQGERSRPPGHSASERCARIGKRAPP